METTSDITFSNRFDHLLARWGYKRSRHRIEPGLYSLGHPNADTPVFVTANYTLSFDALRASLKGTNAYILVLDTKGINVWCAAGKGTFGTEELVHRITVENLAEVVNHRRLILPQLGASGVSPHEVRKRSGFRVEYGPIRARDLPAYMLNGAQPHMRKVSFGLRERLAVIPVDLVHAIPPLLLVAVILFFLLGITASAAAVAATLAGIVLFPVALPFLPMRAFSAKGFLLGGLAALPFALAAFFSNFESHILPSIGWALAFLLTMPAVTAFLALSFTGSTTFTSKTGVKREIFRFVPIMAYSFGGGILLVLLLIATSLLGGAR